MFRLVKIIIMLLSIHLIVGCGETSYKSTSIYEDEAFENNYYNHYVGRYHNRSYSNHYSHSNDRINHYRNIDRYPYYNE